MSEAYGIQDAMRMSQIVICVLSGSTVLFHIISLTARFSEKSYLTKNVFSTILSETFVILIIIQRAIITNAHTSTSSHKVPVIHTRL